MNNYFSWLIESGISLSIFYLAYRIFLNRENLFQSNRGYLLFALIFSALLPLIKIPSPVDLHYSYYLPEVAVTMNSIPAAIVIENQISMLQILWYVYLLGIAIMLGTFLYRLNQLIRIIRKSQVERKGKILLAKTKLCHTPFSFLNVIVFNDENLSWEEKDKIMEHEGVHVSQFHTLDILLVEIIAIFQWFNPFIWLYKISLKELHEYLADREVIRKGANIPVYQQLLLNFQLRRQYITLANNFNYSLTKKRFTMMTKRKSGFMAWIKLFLLLPLLSLLLVSMTNFDTSKSMVRNNDQSNDPTSIEFSQTINDPLLAYHSGDTSLTPVIRQENTLQKVINAFRDIQNINYLELMFIDLPENTVEPFFTKDDTTGKKFHKYISENLKYPEYAQRYKIQGVVFVEFTITEKGEVVNAKVLKPINEYLDREAVRVINNSPRWEVPGKQNGTAIEVKITIPITFKLDEEKTTELIDEEIFIIVEEMPKFIGEDSKRFSEYIDENVVYPEEAAKAGIQGRVFVSFIVDDEGVVKDAKIVRGVHELLDAEAIRVVEASPQWIPGKQRGKAVNVQYTFPILFSLNNEKSEESVPVTSTEKSSSKDIFVMVEEMPNFMGEGSQKFRDFIEENVKYPEEAMKNGIQGRVFIQFIINSEGKVMDAIVVRGVNELLDAEAIRVVESSPDWTPGKQRGKPVNVRMTFPINFSLGE